MAFGVFILRTDSIYNDVPSEQYQFPKQYLSRAEKCEGDWIVYLEPRSIRDTKGYHAVARVQEIIPDPRKNGMYLALIEPGSYLDFGDPVPFKKRDFIIEQGLVTDQGKISGRVQHSVRTMSPEDFARIIERGIGSEEDILARMDEAAVITDHDTPGEFMQHMPARERVLQLTNRAVRDHNFRKIVLGAYNERCAITGLHIVNGGGRAEVEAAHIKPVECNGPDAVRNGIALSRTAHWMFDRGLVGLEDDLTILISRQSNDPDGIRSMLNHTGRLLSPQRVADRPLSRYLSWHRDNRFKN